jgi:hypothetical protein
MAKAIWKGLQMRDDVKVKVDLEAEDSLAVRLNSMEVTGARPEGSVRDTLQRQAQAISKETTWLEGGAPGLVEVDGVSNATLMRSKKPEGGRFIQVVLKGGDSIQVEAKGGATHLSRENYEKLKDLLTGLVE